MFHAITAAAATACTRPGFADLTLDFLPWALIILLAGMFMGAVVGWISRRAGDNRWESLRHGLTAWVTCTGPLLAVLLCLLTLASQCR
ncbi:hypothetical protein ABZ839_33195 [Streptomyces cellulosae]